jgi:hypothetical protein
MILNILQAVGILLALAAAVYILNAIITNAWGQIKNILGRG